MNSFARIDEDGATLARFGLDPDTIANELNALVEGIRAGRIIPQSISTSTLNTQEDFETETLTLTFAEVRKNVPEELLEMRADGDR